MTQDLSFPPDGEGDSDALPLYLQVASTLRTAILRGIYPVGSRIPTEEELCRRFKVSRHTIREALRQLRADSLITSRPGSRPVVAPPFVPREPERFVNEIGKDFFDYTIGTRLEITSMEMEPIPGELMEEVGTAADEHWLCVNGYRISIDDGRATCWNSYLLPARYAMVGRLLARHVGPILPLLEDLFDQHIARITRSIAAVSMPADHAVRLGTARGDPALGILTRCETVDGGVAMLNRSIHPVGVISYTIRR